jgi:predicted transcriptional regulator
MADYKQNWAAALRVIYEEEITFGYWPYVDLVSDEKEIDLICEKSDLNVDEVQNSLKYLEDVGLLGDLSNRETTFGLTKKGFQVAHEREIAERQRQQERHQSQRQTKSNYAVAYFTFGLLAMAAAEALIQASIGAGISKPVIMTVGLMPAVMFLFLSRKMEELDLLPKS